MAFRFKLGEPVEKGLRRISAEQFAFAIEELTVDVVLPSGVHQSRKVLKRLRGLLRLVGPTLGTKVQKTRNARLRDIGRLLSGRRDQAVVVDTLGKLMAAASASDAAVLAPLKQRLEAPELDLAGALDRELCARVREQLIKEAKAFAKLKIKGKSFAAFEAGLEKTYRQGRLAVRNAYRNPNDDAFHDVRKMVQAHWRHMSILSRAWPEMMEVRVAAGEGTLRSAR